MTSIRRRLMLGTMVALLLLGSCGGNGRDDDGPDSTPRSTTTSAVDGTSATTGLDDPPVTTGGSPATTALSSATTQSGAGAGQAEADPEADGVIEVNISGGEVEGGVQRRTVKKGAQVTLRFTSDAPGEIHVHTYDLRQVLSAGQSADITFLAKTPGVFEVELENRKRTVLELEVKP